ncbi:MULTISPECIES: GNAT family N-acetyltransferase [unclassified Streptomyces]|uniref:GNAT family N-acetyltransferase n=1 Tax=unclassified Streptomyces TaxID=2593676 RepID=UPI0022566F4A|nr:MULTISPECIES: GNAT family N-acetyltransferase [unclassified Streptomyces]MCX5139988.1 GNAT family N-acetyltransferase [Streptomyces sp. NBC_00338]WRZ64610.1 GNAT family N-acetyltransferase [Streptomyces sp. NBC_01257]WSU58581.1 GNAT family N-acetyltransferase [Streptomyces sp. NBC_01104]
MTWTVTPEHFDSPDAALLRRDYYDEVASRYWGRPATAEEIDEGLTDDGAEQLVPPTGGFVVGRIGGRAAACAGLLVKDADTAELTRVYVRPEARGTGGGGLLLGAVESLALELGVRQIRLDTRSDLIEARGLYAKHGYEEVPAFHRRMYADHWFAKQLDRP